MRLAFCAAALAALACLLIPRGADVPVAIAASFTAGLMFSWAAEIGGWQAGACAAVLLISNRLWHGFAGLPLVDGLEAASYPAAVYCLFADPWLESGFAMAGFLVTGALAGWLAPLALLVDWPLAPRNYRANWRRALAMAIPLLVLAAVRFHNLTMGGNSLLLYFSKLLLADPVVLALAFAALPPFGRELRRRSPDAVLLAVALLLPVAALAIGPESHAAYLLPLVPLLAILAAAYNPLCSGPSAKWTVAALVVVFAIKIALPAETWGLPFGAVR